jgi:hypothetical protein
MFGFCFLLLILLQRNPTKSAPDTCNKTHILSPFTLSVLLCLWMWRGNLYLIVFHFYKVCNVLKMPRPCNIQLRICQKPCVTLSKSSICLHGNVTTDFHESWKWKWGVSEFDSNVVCFLGSEFGILIAITVKRHWDENHKKLLRNKKADLEI